MFNDNRLKHNRNRYINNHKKNIKMPNVPRSSFPSRSYAVNKKYAMKYNATHQDKIRYLTKMNQRKYNAFKTEWKRLCNILIDWVEVQVPITRMIRMDLLS